MKGRLLMDYIFSDKVSHLQASAIREILKFTADPEVISFAAGNPAPDTFPVSDVTKIIDDIMKENPIAALQYSVTEGYTPLREALKRSLRRTVALTPSLTMLSSLPVHSRQTSFPAR